MNVALTARSLSDLAPEAQYEMLLLTESYDYGDYDFAWVLSPRYWKEGVTRLFAAIHYSRIQEDATSEEAYSALLVAFFGVLQQDPGLFRRTLTHLGLTIKEGK